MNFELGSLVKELLRAIPTIVEGIEKAIDGIRRMNDAAEARRTARDIEEISDQFGRLIFEPDGLRGIIRKYCEENQKRGAWQAIRSRLNDSQELYNKALKATANLSKSFKARHPELMDALRTYLKAKGTILSGIGEKVRPPCGENEIQELRELDPLFEEINTGITKVRLDIKKLLAEFDHKDTKKT